MSFSANQFKKYKEAFILAQKKVLKKNISKNPQTLEGYEAEIIATHDAISSYIAPFYENFNDVDKQFYRNELIYVRDKTLKCFGALNSKKKVSKFIIALLENTNDLTDVSDTEDSETSEEKDLTFQSTENDLDEIEFMSDDTIRENTTQEQVNNTNAGQVSTSIISHISDDLTRNLSQQSLRNENNITVQTTEHTMAITLLEYLRFAASTLNKNYSGDPLALSAFINAVNLVKSVDTENSFAAQLKTFVISKLEGKALECIDESATLDDILKKLKESIKPDSSNVINGRMLSLKLSKGTTQNFAEEAEKLADALQRALVVEGISLEKAKEMSIESTVKMCRQSARSDLVKSVLASSTFKDPKEVIAKLLTEQNAHEQEKQVLAFQRNQGNFRKNNGRYYNNKKFNNNGNKNFKQNNGNRYNGNKNNRNYNNKNKGNYNVRVAENLESPSTSGGQNQNQTFTIEKANSRY